MAIQIWIKINTFAEGTIKLILPSQKKVSLTGVTNRIQQVRVQSLAFVFKLAALIYPDK